MSWNAAKRDVCLTLAETANKAHLMRSVLQQHLNDIIQVRLREEVSEGEG